MYPCDDRLRAVRLYIKLGKRAGLTIRQLGYTMKNALKARHWACEQRQGQPRACLREGKYTTAQRALAVDHFVANERCLAGAIQALGYWRGDEMMRLVARTLAAYCDPRRDFVGHVGGDDFVLLFQGDDWRERAKRIVAAFNDKARELFDAEALARGGIEAEDRHGVLRFFPCTTLSIGATPVAPGRYLRAEQVASAAAAVKHLAKTGHRGLVVAEA